MTRGRKPKPNLRIFNDAKKPTEKPKARRCPKHLSSEQRKIWRALIKMLDAEGMYDDLDTYIVEAFVVCYGRWLEAERGIAEHGMVIPAGDDGKGNPTRIDYSPYYVISNRMIDQMRKLAAEIGLSPTARARVIPDAGGTGSATLTNFMSFVTSRGG